MNERHDACKTNGVRRRAAEIRRHWSPVERARRADLPPDMPYRLRERLLGRPEDNWEFFQSFHVDELLFAALLPTWWPIDDGFKDEALPSEFRQG